jgi:hypothetical protein
VTVETSILQRVDRRLIRDCRCNRADHEAETRERIESVTTEICQVVVLVRVTVATFILKVLVLYLTWAVRVTRDEHDNVIGLAIGLRTVEKGDLEVARLEYRDQWQLLLLNQV